MRWFRRRRGGWLGTYEPPEPRDPAPLEDVVSDGMLIAESVVRMTLRNRVIVDALRDGRDLDRAALAAAAAAELESLADHEWESAQRVRFRREGVRLDDPFPDDDTDEYRVESERRERVHVAMSEAFAARATQRDILDSIVERARKEAWDEVAPVLAQRIMHEEPVADETYVRERDERIATLLALDLTALAAERGVELS
jgi:hypothetical protein